MKRFITTILTLAVLTLPAFGSDPGFQLLEVDGIRVHIDELRFARNYSDSKTSGSIAVGQTVDLTGDLSDAFSNGINLRLEFGEQSLSYDHVNVEISGGVGIKGHTYLAGSAYHVYTSASGIQTVDTGSSAWSAPSGYDYLTSPYLYYPGDNGEENETTFLDEVVTYEAGAALDISLLVDTFQAAYYWDGQDSSRHGFVDTWHQENSSHFPSGTEVIGITYLPLYVAVNTDLSSETYVVATDAADLAGPTYYDQKRTMTMTLAFDDAEEFFIGRSANWDGLDVTLDLPQFVTGATASAGVYDLDLESYDGGWTDSSSIAGFTRLALNGTSTATFYDATGGSQTIHYKRVK